MKKKRLIPVLLLRNGWLVQSKSFSRYQNIGNPTSSVMRFSEWACDELIYLDITKDNVGYDMRRDDLGHPNRNSLYQIIEDVAKVTFMPITIGGGIRNLGDIEKRLSLGADKVSINTAAVENSAFIDQAAREFGSQCIVVSVDAKLVDGVHRVAKNGAREITALRVTDWIKQIESCGAGEILINSVDRDGMKTGYDLDLLNQVADSVKIPVIGLGGVGEWSHLEEALTQTNVDAIAAANIFHYNDQSVYLAKKYLFEKNLNVRSPDILKFKG